MLRIKERWRALRSHPLLSLGFDVLLIIAVFLLIHGWNTRQLPDGAQVPDLALAPLQTREGMAADLQPLPGTGTGVVYFFAPWCFYCRSSIANLDRLVEDGHVAWARAVALDYSNHDEVLAFIGETGLRQPVLMGNAQAARDWNIRAYPTYFVIDADGRISSRSVGYSTRLGLWARARFAQ